MVRIEKFMPDSVLFKQGDANLGQLIYVIEGELLVFTHKGSEVTPLAIVKQDEFIGEVSYFLDRSHRSANVIARSECSLLLIDREALTENIPNWLGRILNSLAMKLQILDNALNDARIKKRSKKLPELSVQESKHLLSLLQGP